jgi:prenyltransferase beta subunit
MTSMIEKFLSERSAGSGLYAERGETQPTMEALRWGTEIRAMLGVRPLLSEEAHAFLAACLRSAGAYATSPDHPEPALNATYYATKILSLAGGPWKPAPELAVWTAGTVFGPSGNVRVDVDDLFYAVRAMQYANQEIPPDLARRAVMFLRACADPGGGFGLLPGEPPDIERTYCCAMMLSLLSAWDSPSPHRAFTARTLRDGLFHMRPDASATRSLATQYWGARAAGMCGVPLPCDEICAFVVAKRNPDGGFGDESRESTLWQTYCAMRVLALCGRKVA